MIFGLWIGNKFVAYFKEIPGICQEKTTPQTESRARGRNPKLSNMKQESWRSAINDEYVRIWKVEVVANFMADSRR
jgi:hypothetical protein